MMAKGVKVPRRVAATGEKLRPYQLEGILVERRKLTVYRTRCETCDAGGVFESREGARAWSLSHLTRYHGLRP